MGWFDSLFKSDEPYAEAEMFTFGWEAVASAAAGGKEEDAEGNIIDSARFTNDTRTGEGRALVLARLLAQLTANAQSGVSLEEAETLWQESAGLEGAPWVAVVADWSAWAKMPEASADKVIAWASNVVGSAKNRDIQERAVVTDTLEKVAEDTVKETGKLSGYSLVGLLGAVLVGAWAFGKSKGSKP